MSRDLDQLKSDLASSAEALLLSLFGKPTRRSAREWRWGRKGSISVRFDGKHGPRFHSFETGEGGSLLDAIMFSLGCEFAGAMQYAHNFLGGSKPARKPPQHLRAAIEPDAEQICRIKQAGEVWRLGVPVSGTVAERYLHARALTRDWPSSVSRFVSAHDVVNATQWKWWHWSAAAFPVTNAAGEVQAVQLVALSEDGAAARHWEHGGKLKVSRGSLAGSAVRFPGSQAMPLLLAEGPETAASCWQATGFETWATLGSIANAPIASVDLARIIVICADDDPRNAPSNKMLRAAVRRWRMEGRTVLMAKPWPLTRCDKSDFNDLLQAEGFDAVMACIGASLPRAFTAADLPFEALLARFQLRNEMSRSQDDLFRASKAAPPFHAFKVAPGLGKTEEMIKFAAWLAANGFPAVMLAPTHKLSGEIARRMANALDARGARGKTARVEVWRGREAMQPDGSNEPMCADLKTVREALRVGADVRATVCEVCPHSIDCPYLAQTEKQPAIWLAAHDLLFTTMPEAMRGARVLFIDEGFDLKGLTGMHSPILVPIDELERIPAVASPFKQADIAAALMPARAKLRAALHDHPEGGLSRQRLLSAGLTVEQAVHARDAEGHAKVHVKITANTTPHGLKKRLHEAAENEFVARRIMLWQAIADLLADESATYAGRIELVRHTDEKAGATARVVRLYGMKAISSDWRDLSTVHGDATLDIDLLRFRVPRADLRTVIEARQHMKLRQFTGRAFGKGALLANGGKLLRQVMSWAKQYAAQRGGRWLIVMPKAAQELLEQWGDTPGSMEVAHFNALAGRDEWRDVAGIIVVGRPMPPPGEVERLAAILTGREVNQRVEGWYPARLTTLSAKSGQVITVEVDCHPDVTAERIRARICEGELLQAIGRVRAVNRSEQQPVEVVLLANVVVPGLIPDELAEWTPHDADSKAFADSGVWLSSSADMAQAAGVSAKSIENARLRRKSPPGPYNDSLYGPGGDFVTVSYRRHGQGRSPQTATFARGRVADIRHWLTEKLGPVEIWDLPDKVQLAVTETCADPPDRPMLPLRATPMGHIDVMSLPPRPSVWYDRDRDMWRVKTASGTRIIPAHNGVPCEGEVLF